MPKISVLSPLYISFFDIFLSPKYKALKTLILAIFEGEKKFQKNQKKVLTFIPLCLIIDNVERH